jgi:hypothetical protein
MTTGKVSKVLIWSVAEAFSSHGRPMEERDRTEETSKHGRARTCLLARRASDVCSRCREANKAAYLGVGAKQCCLKKERLGVNSVCKIVALSICSIFLFRSRGSAVRSYALESEDLRKDVERQFIRRTAVGLRIESFLVLSTLLLSCCLY